MFIVAVVCAAVAGGDSGFVCVKVNYFSMLVITSLSRFMEEFSSGTRTLLERVDFKQ